MKEKEMRLVRFLRGRENRLIWVSSPEVSLVQYIDVRFCNKRGSRRLAVQE